MTYCTMSSQHEELLRIHKLLTAGNQPEATRENSKPADSDIQLLRSIVGLLKTKPHNNLVQDDSLAFPQETRDKLKLQPAHKLWQQLDKLNEHLQQDYTGRRQMSLRRLDCLVESFASKGSHGANRKPSDGQPPRDLRGKAKIVSDKVHEAYEKARAGMREEPDICVANLLALRVADCDRLLNSVVSPQKTDCKIPYKNTDKDNKARSGGQSEPTSLRQVIIPQVPDRGGRTDDIRPPSKDHRNGGGHHRHRGAQNKK